MPMKSVSDLALGFRDAESYKNREYRELFNRIFVRTRTLDQLCDPSVYFSIGEKGTGKTAYAVYMANNDYRNHRSSLRYIRETDYQKFVHSTLKPSFCATPDIFLQFLYDHNIISYIADTDDGPFFCWCYRERSPSNIAPKVRSHARYEVHYGLMKSLDLGKTLKRPKLA